MLRIVAIKRNPKNFTVMTQIEKEFEDHSEGMEYYRNLKISDYEILLTNVVDKDDKKEYDLDIAKTEDVM